MRVENKVELAFAQVVAKLADGLPQRADIAKSSGYDRLDQAAISSVMRWKFVPGKRNGVPTAMSYNVPFNWVLE